jgi:hypothetical protein
VAGNEPSDVPTRTAVLEHRADATDRTLESLRHDMNSGFAELRGEFGQLRREFGELRGEFGQLRREVGERLAHMSDRMDQHLRWVITTVITMGVAIVGANVGIMTSLLRTR